MSLADNLISEVWTGSSAAMNGRVNLQESRSAGGSVPNTAGFDYPKKVQANFTNDMLRGNWEPTPLSNAFFTQRNVMILQTSVKELVYSKSGSKKYVIDDQDVNELQMIMRGFFLQYAKNNSDNVQGQINELNQMIISWCVPRILSEIDQYLYYLDDVSHMPVPLQHPQLLSCAGTKSLPYQPYV